MGLKVWCSLGEERFLLRGRALLRVWRLRAADLHEYPGGQQGGHQPRASPIQYITWRTGEWCFGRCRETIGETNGGGYCVLSLLHKLNPTARRSVTIASKLRMKGTGYSCPRFEGTENLRSTVPRRYTKRGVVLLSACGTTK